MIKFSIKTNVYKYFLLVRLFKAIFSFIHNPYIKVTGCVSVCLFVLNDLANRCTDMILLGRFKTILGEGTSPQPFQGSVGGGGPTSSPH